MMIVPRAATVAGPEPEMAAKKHAHRTQTMMRPPLMCPTKALAKSISFRDMPDFSIILPPRMKNGIASRTTFDKAALEFIASVIAGRSICSTDTNADIPKQSATGSPLIRSTTNTPISIKPVIYLPPLLRIHAFGV